MKHEILIRTIRKAAQRRGVTFTMVKQGGNHEIWQCGTTKIPIPRHREIADLLAQRIFKEIERELGERWWR